VKTENQIQLYRQQQNHSYMNKNAIQGWLNHLMQQTKGVILRIFAIVNNLFAFARIERKIEHILLTIKFQSLKCALSRRDTYEILSTANAVFQSPRYTHRTFLCHFSGVTVSVHQGTSFLCALAVLIHKQAEKTQSMKSTWKYELEPHQKLKPTRKSGTISQHH
jgi:hypothetical protein